MAEERRGQPAPRAGDRSADGTRVFDGTYWVLQRTEPAISEYSPRVHEYLPPLEYARRRSGGFGLAGVILAIAVGLVISYAPYPAIPSDSLQGALQELAISLDIRIYGTFLAVVLILSVGRRPIDIQLVRSMLVAFVFGFVFAFAFTILFLGASALGPVPVQSRVPTLALPFIGGGIWAVTLGPAIAIGAIVANLVWYRSLWSLKPWLLTRRRARAG